MSTWERVESEGFRSTDRMAVPGGWLYWMSTGSGHDAVVYVPAPPVAEPAPSVEVTEATVKAAWDALVDDRTGEGMRAAIEAALREMGLRR